MKRARVFVSWGPHRTICFLLAFVTAVSPSLQAFAEAPAPPKAAPTPSKAPTNGAIDTTYVSPTAIAMADIRPAQVLKSPFAELLPVEVASAAGVKYLGFDPADVSEVTGFIDQIVPTMPPAYCVAIKFSRPIGNAKLFPQLSAMMHDVEIGGVHVLQGNEPAMPCIWKADEAKVVLATEPALRKILENPHEAKSGALLDQVNKAPAGSDLFVVVDVVSLRPIFLMGMMQAASQVPPDARPLLEAPNLISSVELTANVSKPGTSELVARCNDDAAAERLESIIGDGLKAYQRNMKREFAKQASSSDPVDQAAAKYMDRISGRWAQPLVPARSGSKLTFFHTENRDPVQAQLASVAVMGILVALLLPAVQAAREAARRNASLNNMKQLMLGLLNFENLHKTFPAHAIYSSDGKPVLSWRVAILPYLEENELYKQFHLDEPWDSEHNRELIARMPEVFRNPSQDLPAGKTTYLGVVGEECVFDGTNKGAKMRSITDGTSNTIMLVEANKELATDWTKPDDWKFDPKNPKVGLGKAHPGGWIAAFVDGHIQFVAEAIDTNTLKALFTRAGGEVIRP